MADPGTTIRSFTILAPLGRGGMGFVYRARQPSMSRDVALKEMSFGVQGNPDFAARFLQEARVGGLLAHPNVVVVHDYFEADGAAYIAMEFVERGPLTPLMAGLTLPQSFGVLEAVLSALSHAGAMGIVHRDLKPANLLVTREGSIKVADFGIAKAYDATAALGFTAPGVAVGTPAYMAPEQAQGGAVDPRTDLYATGALAYEMLAGRPPFDPELSAPALLYKHVHEYPPSPQEVNPKLHPAFAGWIERLLAKRPEDRPPDAATAWSDLEEIVVEQLGWRWRREARLPDGSRDADQSPLTPAPFARDAPSSEYHTYSPISPPKEITTGQLESDLDRRAHTPQPAQPAALAGPTAPDEVSNAPAPSAAAEGASTIPPHRRSATAASPLSPDGETAPQPTRRGHSRQIAALAAATAAAIVVAAIIVLGGGGGGGGTTPAKPPTSTPTRETKASADMRKLLSMVPVSLRATCKNDSFRIGEERARVNCERWSTTFNYALYRDELDARHWFSIGASNARQHAVGRAASCRSARKRTPFVGTWTRPQESRPAGRLSCTFKAFSSVGVVAREWTENGKPVLASLTHGGANPHDVSDEAEAAWRRATS